MGGKQSQGSGSRLNWSQGDLISVPPGHAVAAALEGSETALLVASQDCDIVAPTETEPNVELVAVCVISEMKPEFVHGRHPRSICLPLSDGTFVLGDIRRKLSVSKVDAAGFTRQGARLERKQQKHFSRWLGKRYTRDPFPDEFNRRLDVQKKALEKALKSTNSRHVTHRG